jgi:hypothetical protein
VFDNGTEMDTLGSEEGQQGGVTSNQVSSLLWLIALVPVAILVAIGLYFAFRPRWVEVTESSDAKEDDNKGFLNTASRDAAAAMAVDFDNPMWSSGDRPGSDVAGDGPGENPDEML